MGAWGYGILQNDTAQDGLAELIRVIEYGIKELAARGPDEQNAARLGAAVGLLLQMASWYSFNQEKEVSTTITAALDRHALQFETLPRRARGLLQAVRDGKGEELATRPGRMNRLLQRALFATDVGDFLTQRVYSKREPALFEHREAARQLQEFADHCVSMIDDDFSDESIIDDLNRESGAMGAFATLLVLEPCRVSPRKFISWRKRWRTVQTNQDEDFDPGEFEKEYNKNVELAFRLALKKFGRKIG